MLKTASKQTASGFGNRLSVQIIQEEVYYVFRKNFMDAG